MKKSELETLKAMDHDDQEIYLLTLLVESIDSVRHRIGVLIFFLIVVPLLFGTCSGLL